MPTLADIRAQYPQYDDVPDAKLADGLYQKFYSDLPRAEFDSKIGLKPEKTISERLSSTYENATPGGPLWLAKQFIEGATGAVQSSAQATIPNPTTEEGAFLQNQGRDAGPGFATQAAAIAGPMAPGGTGGVFAAPMASKSILPAAPTGASATPVLDAAKSIGVDIPQYLATDSVPVQRMASAIKNIPLSGDKIVKSADAVNRGLGEAAKGVADSFGAGSTDIAGGAAKDSLSQWIKGGSQKPVNEAYKEVDALINPEVRLPLENTAAEISKIMAERANAKIPGKSGAVSALMDAVQSDGLNYTGVKDLRSFLGEKSPQELIASGINPKEAKRLYGPLTKDLETIVGQAGGETALGKWKEANSLASLTMGQRKQLSKVIGAKGDATPEAVYSRLVGYAGSKSSGDINRLMLARKAMGEDAWNEVASATVARLGRDAQGNFSPDRFFTAYGNFSQAGKNTLFGAKDGLAKSLEDINTVVGAIKDKIGKFSNPSGTAQNLLGAGMLTAAMHEPLTMIGSAIGGRALAEMLSKPATAKATAEYLKAYLAATTKPNESKRLMVDLASRNLATLVSNNVKTVDVKTFLNLLQGAVPAPAKDNENKGRVGRYGQPYPNTVDQQA